MALAATICTVAILTASCRHDWGEAEEFAGNIRCGMSDGDVRSVAARFGIPPDHIWEQDPADVLTVKPRELDFVDVLLEGGRVVAVQRGNYVAFTTGLEFGEVRILCPNAAIPAQRLRDRRRK